MPSNWLLLLLLLPSAYRWICRSLVRFRFGFNFGFRFSFGFSFSFSAPVPVPARRVVVPIWHKAAATFSRLREPARFDTNLKRRFAQPTSRRSGAAGGGGLIGRRQRRFLSVLADLARQKQIKKQQRQQQSLIRNEPVVVR